MYDQLWEMYVCVITITRCNSLWYWIVIPTHYFSRVYYKFKSIKSYYIIFFLQGSVLHLWPCLVAGRFKLKM